MGFVSAGSASSDIVAMLLRRNLKGVLLGEDPLLTDDLWRRMHDGAVPRRGGEGIVRTCMAAVDFALWDLKGKLLNAPVSALLGGRRPRVATYANCIICPTSSPRRRPDTSSRGIPRSRSAGQRPTCRSGRRPSG
jgi:L-alanine-DL-glutamate epimerase-like enolase superfamily enzyme